MAVRWKEHITWIIWLPNDVVLIFTTLNLRNVLAWIFQCFAVASIILFAILKKKGILETCFRLKLCKLLKKAMKQFFFLTYCIWSSPTSITVEKIFKCSLVFLLVSLCTILCFRTLHLTCSFIMIELHSANWKDV